MGHVQNEKVHSALAVSVDSCWDEPAVVSQLTLGQGRGGEFAYDDRSGMMALPGYQDFMLPILKFAGDGGEHTVSEVMESLSSEFDIQEAEWNDILPSGTQSRFYNRVSWAITYLAKSLLLEKTGRGRFKISNRGTELLSSPPPRIDNAYLDRYDEFREFKSKKSPKAESTAVGTEHSSSLDSPHVTPEESLDSAYVELRESLASDLMDRVQAASPRFFEHLVVDLLVAMGYGGSHGDRARVVGRSGDGGIDGVIPEDQLGLDMVYIQAKKWQGSVGPDEIRKFVGSLGEQRASKGVFITSGTYTTGARQAAEKAHARVVLIDGEQLAQLMIDHGIGVTAQKTYVLKKLDGDYFEPI